MVALRNPRQRNKALDNIIIYSRVSEFRSPIIHSLGIFACMTSQSRSEKGTSNVKSYLFIYQIPNALMRDKILDKYLHQRFPAIFTNSFEPNV